MTQEWGSPLTGEQMKLLRAAGLDFARQWVTDFTGIKFMTSGFTDGKEYRLPAGHPAYTLLEKGWLDGRNVRLWFGGDKAPEDWDGSRVLLAYKAFADPARVKDLWWPEVIAYIAKDEVVEQPETVTIAKMTEVEAKRLYPHLDLNTLKDLRLIKETTREERFWALHEPEGTTVPTHIKKWVKAALEFEQN